ncbi:unnamed protein product [Cuscuta campestris]|uniref:DEAD/DEAH box helicase domain-containing protein n=1 Tax=Cuscuta campestris TaxID=132261 RepID=A0A484L725_9ASTE|nr:unnamed protein product [Cuscuta campestris]
MQALLASRKASPADPPNPYAFFACVLSPTRELAVQICQQFSALGAGIGVKCVAGSTANQSEINDLTIDGNTTPEESHDDRWNKDDEVESANLKIFSVTSIKALDYIFHINAYFNLVHFDCLYFSLKRMQMIN